MTLDKVLMPVPDGNPDVFEREWPLRVADIDRYRRLRLDATARHTQDIGQAASGVAGIDTGTTVLTTTVTTIARPTTVTQTHFGRIVPGHVFCSLPAVWGSGVRVTLAPPEKNPLCACVKASLVICGGRLTVLRCPNSVLLLAAQTPLTRR